MILDRLHNAERYYALHPGFPAAFEFLSANDLDVLAEGRHEVDGQRLYAVVIRGEGRGQANARLETHHNYIDVQYCLAGRDCIGWKDVGACAGAGEGYDPEKDYELYTIAPEVWVATPADCFAIFFPEDAHAPMGGTGLMRKIVVKVAIDW